MEKSFGFIRQQLNVGFIHDVIKYIVAKILPLKLQEQQERHSIFSRLALKIIAVISISVLLIQLAFIGVIEDRIYQSELSNIVDQQVTFTEANAIYIAELMSEDNDESLYLILSAIVANPLIVGAMLQYDDAHEPLYVGEELTALEFGFDIKDLNDNDELVLVGRLITYATTAFIDESRSTRIESILALILIVFLLYWRRQYWRCSRLLEFH